MRLPAIFFIFCLVVMTGCATGQLDTYEEDEESAESVEQETAPKAEIKQPKQAPKEEAVSEGEEEAAETAVQKAAPQKAPQAKKAFEEFGEQTYEVWLWQETRDCLWNLAEKYYGDPWLWKKIYIANKDQIDDPRIIYPKQILIIPPLEEGE